MLIGILEVVKNFSVCINVAVICACLILTYEFIRLSLEVGIDEKLKF